MRHPRKSDLGGALSSGVQATSVRHPRKSDLGGALPHGGLGAFAWDILETLDSEMPCPMVVQLLSPETSSQLWVPRCPELRWSSHFRLRHPRKSDLRDAVPHGWSGHLGLRHLRNSDLGYALS